MKNLFKKAIAAIVFTTMFLGSNDAVAQSYEVYDGDKFSVMFKVNNEVAEDVKFASKGDKQWSSFEVIKTKNWEGKSTMKDCVFTFYVVDGNFEGYQIDYYSTGYIYVFNIDHETQQTVGEGWKLNLRQK